MSSDQQSLAQVHARCVEVCDGLRQALVALNLPTECSNRLQASINLDSLRLNWQCDPLTGASSLMGEWRSAHQLHGSLQLLHDGNHYAEFDVLQPHPQREGWFIEAVILWGKRGALTHEPRLLPLPRDDQ